MIPSSPSKIAKQTQVSAVLQLTIQAHIEHGPKPTPEAWTASELEAGLNQSPEHIELAAIPHAIADKVARLLTQWA